jgi:saccharopine dehydrogenase-like NADP-dependent oxidoreductase
LIAGSGAIGSAIASDLARDETCAITFADLDADRLERAAARTDAVLIWPIRLPSPAWRASTISWWAPCRAGSGFKRFEL